MGATGHNCQIGEASARGCIFVLAKKSSPQGNLHITWAATSVPFHPGPASPNKASTFGPTWSPLGSNFGPYGSNMAQLGPNRDLCGSNFGPSSGPHTFKMGTWPAQDEILKTRVFTGSPMFLASLTLHVEQCSPWRVSIPNLARSCRQRVPTSAASPKLQLAPVRHKLGPT